MAQKISDSCSFLFSIPVESHLPVFVMHTIDLNPPKNKEEVYTCNPCYKSWSDVAADLQVAKSTVSSWLLIACQIPDHPCKVKPTPELVAELRDVKLWCSQQKLLKSRYYTSWNYGKEKAAGILQDHLDKLREGSEFSPPSTSHERAIEELGLTRPTFYRYLEQGIGLQKPYKITDEVIQELKDIKLWCAARTLLNKSYFNLKKYRSQKAKGLVQKDLGWIRQELKERNIPYPI
jgi:DNA-binding transcriptional ArsR family regulator